MAKMTLKEIQAAMAQVPGWRRKAGGIECEFAFGDFGDAMGFVRVVAREAEKSGHHPDIDIRWNRVRLALTTHDEGGLTARDFAMAARFSRLAMRMES
jgi:4a-hydroxytetrahydrobiopterin dehydratase